MVYSSKSNKIVEKTIKLWYIYNVLESYKNYKDLFINKVSYHKFLFKLNQKIWQ